MRLQKLTALLLSGAMLLPALPPVRGTAAELVDSGMDYTESTETLNNPGAGYTSTLWYVCKPGETKPQNPTGNLVLMFIDIGAFSSGVNGTTDDDGNYTEGTDYDLDAQFFKAMRETFNNCRKNGCTVAVRFRYDANGKTNPEPASFEQVLHHIDQIKEDGFLEENKDILMYVESGFVGAWGEQHSGKYTSLAYKAQLLDAVLEMTPDDIPVTVRTPNIFREWKGLDMDGMAAWTSEPGSREARVGLYNDGYMGSDSDLGTYSNRAVETAWLGRQTTGTYYGGEFSGNLEWAQKYDTYLPQNAIPEMYATHLSYINSNIYGLYESYTFGAQYDIDGADNSAYYGQTVKKFMRDHLGYRFTVRDCDLSASCEQGGSFDLVCKVENTGFANPIRPQKAELLLEKDGVYITADAPIDSRTWASCTTQTEELHVKLPGAMEPDDWNVYLRLSVGAQSVQDAAMRTVRFANPDIWNSSLGANRLGSISVTATDDPAQAADQKFSAGGESRNAVFYTVNNAVIHDGVRSSASEWTEDTLLGEKDGNRLWVTNDDRYLYIAAEIPQNAEKPVINLRVQNAATGQTYWYYRQSPGWIYYSDGDHSGIQLKAAGDFIEFRIAIDKAMGLAPGVLLEKISVFIQDEADEWKGMGDVAGENYTLTSGVFVYTAFQRLTLPQGSTYSMEAPLSAENATVTWLHDGKQIGTGSKLTLEDVTPDMQGLYTVRIVTADGTELMREICEITDVLSLRGDVNADGIADVLDVVCLQSWLHHYRIALRGDADLNGDGVWDVFDLALLKRLVIEAE